MNSCIFCTPQAERVFRRNDLAYALWDGFPITEMHSLVIPQRHTPDYFSLTPEELLACDELLLMSQKKLKSDDHSIEAFNVGTNVGEVAGQTVIHCHFHLIPRRNGDVDDPRGGIRTIIPGKGAY